MAMYALGILKFQDIISHKNTSLEQLAYADNPTGTGKTAHLKLQWDLVLTYDPKIGYLPNPAKSVLIVKPMQFKQAKTMLQNSGVKETKTCKRNLEAVSETGEFKDASFQNCKWLGYQNNETRDYAKTES